MNSEGFDEMPAGVDASNKAAKEDGAAAVKGSDASKQMNDGPHKVKPSVKTPTRSQVKVGTAGGRQPMPNRPTSTPQSRVTNASKKSNEQEQKAPLSKTMPRSGMSSHAKIMEKKSAAKAVKESMNGACGVSGNGNQSPKAENSRGSPKALARVAKVLPTSRPAAPRVKNPAPPRPNSAASKKPAAVATAKLPAARPQEKPLQSKSSRPDAAVAASSRSAPGAVRKAPAPRATGERPAPARPAKPGVPSTGAQPEKHSAASSEKDLTPSSSQPKKYSGSDASKATNTARATKPKLAKPSEASSAEQKGLDAKLKPQMPKASVKSKLRVQPGTSTSKASVGTTLQQSLKPSKGNTEKQSLPSRRSSTSSRKSLSENDIGKPSAAEPNRLKAEPVKSASAQTVVAKEEITALNTALSNDLTAAAAVNTQTYLTITSLPLPQGVQTVPCLGNVDEMKDSASLEEKVENRGVEATASMGELQALENEGSVESSGQLDEEIKGALNYGQKLDVCLGSNSEAIEVKIENARALDGNRQDSAKAVNAVDLNEIEAELINMGDQVAGINGKMDFNSDNLETQGLPSQQHLLQESTSPSSDGKESNLNFGFLNPAVGGPPVEYVSAIKEDNVVLGPTLVDLVDSRGPTLGGCFEDESSPETNSYVSNAEKVKLTMYEYSEEADTEESPPDELCPETLQSQDDRDLVFKPQNLPVETVQVTCKSECPVENGNWPPGQKLGISPEDSHEDPGVSKSSTLSGPDLAGKSSSTTSTPEELKDYDSSSGVESKSDEKLEPADLCIPQTDELSPLEDLLDPDLGIHLERGDEEPETLAADDLHGDPPTEPIMSSEDDHSEADLESVMTGEPIQCGLEGIDNPVFEDKAATESKSEAQPLALCSPYFKPLTLHAVDETEELATAETPHSLGFGQLDYTTSDSLAPQNCLLSGAASSLEDPTLNQIENFPAAIGHQSCGPEVSLSVGDHCRPPQNERSVVPEVAFPVHREHDLTQDQSSELANQQKSGNLEQPVAGYARDCLGEDLTNLQMMSDPATDANGGRMQQQYYSVCEKNDSVKNDSMLTGILSEGDKTLQTHACVPWMTPLLPPILSTIYEVETAETGEETRLEDDFEKEEELQKPDWRCLELIEDPSEKVLTLQIKPVEVVQQLINQTLLLSGDGVKLQSKVMVDKAELSKWTDLISPLDDSTASITSVTSFSPEDLSSSQGEWTVVELETHH